MHGHARAVLAAMLALPGCAPRSESSPDATAPILVAELRRALDGREPGPACGDSRPFTSGRALLVLTARDCMSCRSVGYLIRQLERRTEFDILTPEEDASEVCRFVAEERVGSAVFRFKAGPFRNAGLGDRFLLFRRDARGGVESALLDNDANRLLAGWDASRRGGSVP